jgi:hypothetical protein
MHLKIHPLLRRGIILQYKVAFKFTMTFLGVFYITTHTLKFWVQRLRVSQNRRVLTKYLWHCWLEIWWLWFEIMKVPYYYYLITIISILGALSITKNWLESSSRVVFFSLYVLWKKEICSYHSLLSYLGLQSKVNNAKIWKPKFHALMMMNESKEPITDVPFLPLIP